MSDLIRLTGLRARGRHGVFAHEREHGQDFLVDIDVPGDLGVPGATDELADTVDYGALAQIAVDVVTGPPKDLIESVAADIAQRCLEHCPTATVTVHKPEAPIPHAFADVSVTVTRTRSAELAAAPAGRLQAILALGANLGEPLDALRRAVASLDRHPRIAVEAASGVWRTAPVGPAGQPDYLNAAVRVAAELTPPELLAACQGIEAASGRVREVRWGARTLDIDLIRCAEQGSDLDDPAAELVLGTPVLDLPHPLAAERAFVLAPWSEIAPDARVRTGAGTAPIASALDSALASVREDGGVFERLDEDLS